MRSRLPRIAAVMLCSAFLSPGLVVAPSVAFAAEHPAAPVADVYAETSVITSLSWFGSYVSTEPHFIWRPAWFGLGAGAKLSAGTTQFDLHAAPFARVELWWMYMNAGWSFELVAHTERYRPFADGLFVAAGASPDLIPLGYGRLGIDVGVEAFPGIPGTWRSTESAGELVRSWDPPQPMLDALTLIAGTFTLKAAVLYTFPL
jgi:hypothetical protein